ncbi:MAG: aminotransferase class III-fold pyridoxal phosphate-dependent enzyme [Gammaproteobacteria bacterium]|jgi:acetylornithine/succinyldiaminopimelate/putrescine aminotransferase/predicted amino acid dehydrogenase
MSARQSYKQFCKPKLAELLSALRLDNAFTEAHGSYLYTDDGREVLDLIGGFGAAIVGHNHPEVVAEAVAALQGGVPVHAQGSVRSASARLAERLSALAGTGKDYVVNFSNSGAEAVEAAIKHAYKKHFDKVLQEYERITRLLNDFYYRVEREQLELEFPGKNDDLIDFRDDLDEYNLAQFESFQNNPEILAFKGSFHGKTSSALKVTFNKSYREPFEGLSALRPNFIDFEDVARIPEIVNDRVCTFYYPVVEGRKVVLRAVSMTRVIAFALEVVLGEGGIRPVPDTTLEQLAVLAERRVVPLIVDEIQTGCGRLGPVFAYHETPLGRIAPDYVTLSKALGGGVAKIGATLMREDIYDHDFGILHTSTFGEDDLSSRLALKTLDIITRPGFADSVRETGEYLRSQLADLQAEFPDIVREVRGKGLMVGVELTTLHDRSPFFRATGKQGVLSLLVASYLLEHHDIRLLAPLTTILKGNPGKKRLSMLRIQPPATVTHEELGRLVQALREVFTIIRNNNEYCLIAHLVGETLSPDERRRPGQVPVKWPVVEETRHIDARTGFVVHPTTLDNLVEYYFPSFAGRAWQGPALVDWWNLVSRFLEPVHVKSSYITSDDFCIENSLVFVPYFPEYLVATRAPHLRKEIRDKIQDAVTLAKELGDENIPLSIVGLGAYTSIATQNGLIINDYEMPVTTGNAYTTALSIMGILEAARRKGLDLARARVAVVGAGGNIGQVVAQILAPRVGHLKLVGRDAQRGALRLRHARSACLKEIVSALAEGAEPATLGQVARDIDRALAASPQYRDAIAAGALADSDARALEALLPPDTAIEIRTGLSALKDCDIVAVATSSPERNLIRPELVRHGAIVCCTSVPTNLSAEFEQRQAEYLAFDGGLARLPEDSEIHFVGMPSDGLAYGCLSETLVLGFEGQNHSFGKGVLTAAHVYRVMEMAYTHGFRLGQLKLNDRVLPQPAALSTCA